LRFTDRSSSRLRWNDAAAVVPSGYSMAGKTVKEGLGEIENGEETGRAERESKAKKPNGYGARTRFMADFGVHAPGDIRFFSI
jgi:hypothetical protein